MDRGHWHPVLTVRADQSGAGSRCSPPDARAPPRARRGRARSPPPPIACRTRLRIAPSPPNASIRPAGSSKFREGVGELLLGRSADAGSVRALLREEHVARGRRHRLEQQVRPAHRRPAPALVESVVGAADPGCVERRSAARRDRVDQRLGEAVAHVGALRAERIEGHVRVAERDDRRLRCSCRGPGSRTVGVIAPTSQLFGSASCAPVAASRHPRASSRARPAWRSRAPLRPSARRRSDRTRCPAWPRTPGSRAACRPCGSRASSSTRRGPRRR